MDAQAPRYAQQMFPDGFHRHWAGYPEARILCWGRFVRQSSCPSSFAEVGFELISAATPGVNLVCRVEDRDVLAYRDGVVDGIQAVIGDPPGTHGGIEISWVHGVEHPVDSNRRAFRVATEVALRYALGEPQDIRGASGGIGFTSRRAAHA